MIVPTLLNMGASWLCRATVGTRQRGANRQRWKDIGEGARPHGVLNVAGCTIDAANTGDTPLTSRPKISSVPIVPSEVEGTLEAPVIYFEATSTHGVGGGVGRLALEMMLSEPSADGTPISRRKIVVHLRGPLGAFISLKAAIEHIEEMAAGPLTADIAEDGKPN